MKVTLVFILSLERWIFGENKKESEYRWIINNISTGIYKDRKIIERYLETRKYKILINESGK